MNYLIAFIVGGFICVVGQIIIDKTKLTPARIMVGYVVSGVILGGIGIYNIVIDFAGAGASVPLLGFGNSLAKGIRDGINETGFIGIFTGALSATAGGITAAILFGYLTSIIFKPRGK